MITRQIIDMVDVGIVTFDKELHISDWNNWMKYHSGLSLDDVKGKKIHELFENLNKPWFHNNCRSVIKFGNYAFFSQKLHNYCIPLKAEGKFRKEYDFMQQNCTLGPLRDEKNRITELFLMVNDVTEISHYEKVLTEMANFDGLTGAWSRQYFDRRIEEECSRNRRFKRSMSIIMLDVDHFKNVNDTLGHLYGDFVLKEMVTIIKNRIREIDLLARYGGEEFVILLPETDKDQSLFLAEEIRKIIEKHQFIWRGNKMDITISLGVSSLNNETCKLEELMKEADDALYLSKDGGRNCVSTIVSSEK